MDRKQYQYSPLPDKKCIRLLEAVGTGPHSTFRLLTASLDNCPPYVAISYTWDPALFAEGSFVETTPSKAGTCEVICEDAIIRVHDTVLPALTYVRDPSRLQPRIWLDAISINQDDHEERAGQVEIMGEIYASADEVLITLGQQNNEFRQVDWLHTDFVQALNRHVSMHGKDSLKKFSPLDDALFKTLGFQTSTYDIHGIWQSYVAFYARQRWFTRAWTLQEFVLSKRPTIMLGVSSLIDWNNIHGLSKLLHDLGWMPSLRFGTTGVFATEANVLGYLRQICQSGALSSDFRDIFEKMTWQAVPRISEAKSAEQKWYTVFIFLINMTRSRGCTDSRDKLFGLIGILKKLLPKDMEMPFQPDYILSITDLCIHVAEMLVLKVPRLLLLSLNDRNPSERLEGLPSWVPDLSGKIRTNPLYAIGNGHAYDVCRFIDYEDRTCELSNNQLALDGAILDNMEFVGPSLVEIFVDANILLLLKFAREMGKSYEAAGENRIEALWRTCIGNFSPLTVPAYPAPSSLAAGFRDVISRTCAKEYRRLNTSSGDSIQAFKDHVNMLAEFRSEEGADALPTEEEIHEQSVSIAIFTMTATFKRLGTSSSADTDGSDVFENKASLLLQADQFMESINHFGTDHRLFRTSRGLIGLCPDYARAGNEVIVIKGATVPFVVQSLGENEYQLLGDVYVHGYMNGEIKWEPGFVEKFHRIAFV